MYLLLELWYDIHTFPGVEFFTRRVILQMAWYIQYHGCPFLQSIGFPFWDSRMTGIYLTGGGRRNLFMVERLQTYLGTESVLPVEALGFDGDLLEAVSFAVLGGCFVLGIGSTMERITGAAPGGVAGKLSLPPAVT